MPRAWPSSRASNVAEFTADPLYMWIEVLYLARAAPAQREPYKIGVEASIVMERSSPFIQAVPIHEQAVPRSVIFVMVVQDQ